MYLRFMRDVKPCHYHRNTRLEYDFGGFGIHEDVELGGGRPVSEAHRTTHNHDTGDFGVQLRMAIQEQCDVSLRPGGDNRHRFRAFTQGFRHQFHGGTVLWRKSGFRQRRAIQPTLAVNVIGDNQIAH